MTNSSSYQPTNQINMPTPASPQITTAPETYYFPLTINELAQLLDFGDYG